MTDMSLPSPWDAAPKLGSEKAISGKKLHENRNSGQIRAAERAHSPSLNGLTTEEDMSDMDQDIQALATVCVVVGRRESFVRSAGKPILHSPIVIQRRREVGGAPLACFITQVHAPRFSRHHPQMGLESVTPVHPIVYCEAGNCITWEGTPTVTADSLIPSQALEVSPVTLMSSEYRRWDDGNGGSQRLVVDTQQGEAEVSDNCTSEGYHSAASPDQDDPGAVHPTSVTPSIVTEPALMPPTKVCTESVQSSYPVHQPKFARISQAFWAMKRSRKERQSGRELKQNATEGILTIANILCSGDTDLSKAVDLERED
ncbi:unnamed protein product [Calicophoron daubneyi]|uniref:Uncharacterized protein n=1 Tax=Calicophoron daubneyi TaxID=300641 RepID=A0AAV2T0G3_CALDB